MIITAEVSYYALKNDFGAPVESFLAQLKAPGVNVDTGTMSTMLTGEYDAVTGLLNGAMRQLMEQHPSVFTVKLSNCCAS